eukprot:6212284-Pleurochrysis_carterae.AAC.5
MLRGRMYAFQRGVRPMKAFSSSARCMSRQGGALAEPAIGQSTLLWFDCGREICWAGSGMHLGIQGLGARTLEAWALGETSW